MIHHSEQAFWHAWISEIIKGTSENEIRRHIRDHIEELSLAQTSAQKKDWIASMRNLLTIFEGVEGEEVNVMQMLARLNEKFISDPDKFDAPPKAELRYQDQQLIVPSSFEVERGYTLRETLQEIVEGCFDGDDDDDDDSGGRTTHETYSGGIS